MRLYLADSSGLMLVPIWSEVSRRLVSLALTNEFRYYHLYPRAISRGVRTLFYIMKVKITLLVISSAFYEKLYSKQLN